MSLRFLKNKVVRLPVLEAEDGLKAKDIMDKMRGFNFKLEKAKVDPEGYVEDFLQLLLNYPSSMCNRHMTETMKLLISLFYFGTKPLPQAEKPSWLGFTYDDLSIIFGRSKASVHEAIRQKEAEAKQLLENVDLRKKAKEIALKQMVEEEKQKLKRKKSSSENE